VPRLPVTEKVWVEDPSSPAPGADAFRWFFYASSPSWTNTRHSLSNVRLEQKEFLVKLRNVYSFFVIYANIDAFDPKRGLENPTLKEGDWLAGATGWRPATERSELDRWLASELALATKKVTEALDGYLLYDAARTLVDFVESLSNWYVRRSRERFWAKGRFDDGTASADKADAYFTLYEALVATARLAAPFVPFFADELWQNLVRQPIPTMPESVHLAAWPSANEAAIDAVLAKQMRAVRELVSLGLQVRNQSKVSVAQPLAQADVVVSDAELVAAVRSHLALVAEELNVHEVKVLAPGEEAGFVRYTLKPNFRALGPKLGKKVQACKATLAKADAGALRAELATKGAVTIDVEGEAVTLGPEEIEVAVDANEGFAAAGGRAGVVVLHTQLTDALRDEGLARKILRAVQQLRKELGLDFADRIALRIGGSERARRVAEANRVLIAAEALADQVTIGEAGEGARASTVDGEALEVAIARS
jgi:isoleucyl-tRNA synthetase